MEKILPKGDLNVAELPEIAKIAGQMRGALRGKTIERAELLQEKCLNVPPGVFQSRIAGARVEDVRYKGKWIIHRLGNGENILLSPGMGADILYFEDGKDAAEKFQIKVLFRDGSGYTVRFWWFGKYLLASDGELESEPNTKDIAIDPFDARFTPEYFAALLRGKKKGVKAFLMDQKNVGGIGNMYMHDILFRARLHPRRKISDMDEGDIRRLYDAIMGVLSLSRSKGASAYEKDFFGQKGGYGMDDFLVGYKEGKPCPACGAAIVSIKSGGSATYICPACQKA